jgi:hypothetical protein
LNAGRAERKANRKAAKTAAGDAKTAKPKKLKAKKA